MTVIHYQKGKALIESVALSDLAEQYGTPLFVYSADFLLGQCDRIKKAFSSHPTTICFAMKANSNEELLRQMVSQGLGMDVVSGGELKRALHVGTPAKKIVFSGVGKTASEIELGIGREIFSFNVESVAELDLIGEISKRLGKNVSVSLRINPNISVKTNPYIATGLYRTKFGFPENQIPDAVATLKKWPRLKLVGLSCHLGSQIRSTQVYQQATTRLLHIAEKLKASGFVLSHLDLGGGFGVAYKQEANPEIEAYAQSIQKALAKTPYQLMIEPGRWLVAECGILLSRVLFTKENPHKRFVIVDAAMTELIRPALYEAYHPIEPCLKRTGAKRVVDVVGPVCETADFLGLKRSMSPLQSGDLIWIGYAGAYGFSMASNYNLRPRPAEVLVQGAQGKLIRKRESL